MYVYMLEIICIYFYLLLLYFKIAFKESSFNEKYMIKEIKQGRELLLHYFFFINSKKSHVRCVFKILKIYKQ